MGLQDLTDDQLFNGVKGWEKNDGIRVALIPYTTEGWSLSHTRTSQESIMRVPEDRYKAECEKRRKNNADSAKRRESEELIRSVASFISKSNRPSP